MFEQLQHISVYIGKKNGFLRISQPTSENGALA